MKIIEKKLTDITPYENNPRYNDDAVEYVATSINEFGFKVPIVIDKNGVIVAGHTRYKAAETLELEKVPCIIADDLTPEQIKAYRLADNKVSERSTWDGDKLNIELHELEMFDMQTFGFEDFQENEPIENEDAEMLDIDESEGGTRHYEKVCNIDGQKIIMTDEECAAILEKLDNYIEINGVSFGFVGALVNGEI